jgi:histidine kinase/DNA gyrase B/HSP90-like ATPase
MGSQSYPVEVQSDILERFTRAKPIQALAEFIWNSLDADASKIDVSIEENGLGAVSRVIVRDNGTGMERKDAPELFRRLGGSWKRLSTTTKRDGRFLHGQDGRGRFKAFTLGKIAEWDVTYQKGNKLSSFTITMTSSMMKEVVISDEETPYPGKVAGVTPTISDLHKDYRSLTSEAGLQELTEIFALYLADYKDVSISINGLRIDPSSMIVSQGSVNLSDIAADDGKSHPVRLDIIEWRAATNRALYLCNDKGFPLMEIERRFHAGSFHFSAYLKTAFVSNLQKQGVLGLAEMDPRIEAVADEAQEAIRSYFRTRAAQEARTVVAEWKDSQIYPYEGEATTKIEEAERQSDDYGEYAAYRMNDSPDGGGKIKEAGNHSIWVKTWGQVIDENRARMQFFQEKLEYEADKGASLKDLQERYAKFLQGVISGEEEEENAPKASAEETEVQPSHRKKKAKSKIDA